MKRSTISEIICLLFVILFLYTGIDKLLGYDVFKEQIAMSPLFKGIAPLVALTLPLVEIAVAITLFWPAWRKWGLVAALVLMILFTGYVVYILNVDKTLPCSCGGFIELLSWKGHLVFNSILIALALTGILTREPTKAKDETNHIAYT